jgi:cytochrome c biogenesis protein CcmG/thiol:disulfide interchange protein DsbE
MLQLKSLKLIGLLCVASVALALSPDESKWREGSPQTRKRLEGLEGAAPPAFQVKDWTNSKPMELADLKGKVVLIDFWATWCGPCMAAVPHNNEMMEKYGGKGLVIIGVCVKNGADKCAATVKEKGMKYPVVVDADGKTEKAYHVDGYPDYYLIDRAGKLRIADCANASVEEAVQALLAESESASAR